MDLNKLTGAQQKVLREAILEAFSRQNLDIALNNEFGQRLDDLAGAPSDEYLILELISKLQKSREIHRLVRALQVRTPDHVRIKNLMGDLRLLTVEGNPNLVDSSLERTVNERAGFANVAFWQETLSKHQRKVCRIEDPRRANAAIGTGFLVGNDLVMTNYHVVSDYIRGTVDTSQLVCRFDYAIESTGVRQGKVVPVTNGNGWIIDHSPYSNFDPGDNGGVPTPSELDYALIKLAAAVGDDPWQDAIGKRGWIAVSSLAQPPEPSDIVFILQHPKGEPLKLAVGAVLQRNSNDTRVRYNANTEPGSSGSPCFNVKLELVGIHHAGDPDTGQLATYNQGIPINKIVSHMAAQPNVPRFWQ